MLVSFVRHAESVGNAARIWQGKGASPLSDTGTGQAKVFADRLASRPFDLVVASPLQRAVETAEALGIPFELDDAWREIDIGAWEGLSREAALERFGDEFAALRAGEPVRLGGTGETLSEFRERVGTAVERLTARIDDGDRALVVCHGGVIDAIVSTFWGVPHGRRVYGLVTNTSITSLVGEASKQRLARFNDAGHLGPLVGWAAGRLEAGDPVLALIRHGQTQANVEAVWQGHSDWGLNGVGVEQAARLAGWYGTNPIVYTSPLGRAYQTAMAVAGPGGPPVSHHGLAEISMGAWEGLTSPQIEEGWPDLWRRIYLDREDLRRGGTGESWGELSRRIQSAIGELGSRHPTGRVVVVSHGGAVRAYLAGLLGLDWEAAGRIATMDNTAVSHVVFTPDGPVIADYNVAPHLEDPPPAGGTP